MISWMGIVKAKEIPFTSNLHSPNSFLTSCYYFHCLFLRFYLFIWQREIAREGTQAWGTREGDAGSQLSREPDLELDLRMLGS